MLSTSKFVQALNERNGIPLAKSTVRAWSRRHPGLTVRIGGRDFWREEVIPLLLAGAPLAEIAARLQQGAGDARTV